MRYSILLLAVSAAILGGCASAYKTGQTPDDVYYSPERQHNEYVQVKDNNEDQYITDDQYSGDQYLRMKVQNRALWSTLDDPYYYTPFAPQYGFGISYYNMWDMYSPWSPYVSWNYYYNPYCSPVFFTPRTTVAYYHPRVFNLNTYTPQTSAKGTMYNYNYGNHPVRIVGVNNSNSNINTNTGNFLRNIFTNSSGNSSSSGSRSSSSNSGGSFGGGGSH
ncbi:MAG TPA: hypothetical protein VGG71_05880, partial [Chitinophagaceae bacterium]